MGASVVQVIPDPVTGADKIVGTTQNPMIVNFSDGEGGTNVGLPSGRADAADCVPTVLSTQDKAALDAAKSSYTTNNGAYINNTARAAGSGIFCAISTGGTATLTFSGVDMAVTFNTGPIILNLPITKVVLGTAAGNFYAIS